MAMLNNQMVVVVFLEDDIQRHMVLPISVRRVTLKPRTTFYISRDGGFLKLGTQN